MDKTYEKIHHELNEEHWWFLARRNMLTSFFSQMPKNSSVLDVGCSDGIFLSLLDSMGFKNINGVDVSDDAVRLAISRGRKYVQKGDALSLKFGSDSFDIVVASDILEHIKDDRGALVEWRRVLKPNGTLIVFVPAHQFLWDYSDELLNHFRRYTRGDIKKLFESVSLSVSRCGYWNVFLFVPIALIRVMHNFISVSRGNMRHTPRILNMLLFYVVKFENWLISLGWTPPFGVSVFCIARKK